MSGHLQFGVFTLFPLLVLVSVVVVSVLKIRYIGKYRLLLLVGILALMGQHQLLEAWRFLRAGATVGGLSEGIETGANVLSSVAVYYGLVFAQRQQSLADDLEASEQRYRTLTEQSPLPVLVHRDGEVLYANDAAADLFDAEGPTTLVGTPVTDLVHPDEREALEDHLDALLDDEGTVRTTEQRWVSLDGDEREVLVSGGCARFGDEQAIHMVFRDLTIERETRRDLQRVRTRFETTMESSNDAIVLIDPAADEIREANRRATELLGYDREELVGTSPTEIHPHEVSAFHEFVDTVQTETSVRTDELSCLTRDGEQVPVEISASLVDDGGDECILASMRDVSGRKRREHQNDVLRRILRHNLRNEMAVVIGYAEMLADSVDDETLVTAAEKIETRAQGLTELSAGVRKLEEVVADSDQRRTVDIAPLVTDIADRYREEYPAATVETDVPDTLTARSAGGLRWALENLVENAVVHTGPEPWVRVSTERTTGDGSRPSVAIRVVDDGPGIPEDERTAVDVSTEQTAVSHGSGFGLHAVGQIATLSGGDLTIEDDPDTGGARVTLTLPAPTGTAGTDPAAEGTSSQQS